VQFHCGINPSWLLSNPVRLWFGSETALPFSALLPIAARG
jgi:hypothetical protein